MRIRRNFCFLLLTTAFLCGILSGCSDPSQPNPSSTPPNTSASSSADSSTNGTANSSTSNSTSSPTNESASSEKAKKDEISVRLDKIFCDCSKYGRATHVCGRDGVWRWEYEHEEYKLHVSVTIKNTGDYRAIIDESNFDAYWDNSQLPCSGLVYSNGFGQSGLLPGNQLTAEFVYTISRNEYENRSKPGHFAKFIVRYGTEKLTYLYATDTETITLLK